MASTERLSSSCRADDDNRIIREFMFFRFFLFFYLVGGSFGNKKMSAFTVKLTLINEIEEIS